MNCGILLGLLLSTSLLARQTSNPPPGTAVDSGALAPTDTPSPAATANTHQAALPSPQAQNLPPATEAEPASAPLPAGPAMVTAGHVNVRGQPKLNSEIVGQLNKGQEVTVLEEIRLKHSGPNEPSAWAKILLPPGVNVWVFSSYIQPTNLTVTARRLNLRSGPGENYSILGRIQRGTAVNQVATKGDWMKIEAPTNAYAFVAAEYLSPQTQAESVAATAQPSPATNTAPETAASETGPTNNLPPTAEATETTQTSSSTNVVGAPGASETNNVAAETQPATNELATAATNELAIAATNAPIPASEQPPPERIVQREGFVRGTFSIQAPTDYELVSPQTGKVINYLYTTSTNLDLSRYKGLHIIVTGQEGLDQRWRNTPVITIRKIQVLE